MFCRNLCAPEGKYGKNSARFPLTLISETGIIKPNFINLRRKRGVSAENFQRAIGRCEMAGRSREGRFGADFTREGWQLCQSMRVEPRKNDRTFVPCFIARNGSFFYSIGNFFSYRVKTLRGIALRRRGNLSQATRRRRSISPSEMLFIDSSLANILKSNAV